MSDVPPKATPASLSPVQAQAVIALAQGQSSVAAAARAGVVPKTVRAWLRDLPHFRDALANARQDHVAQLYDQLQTPGMRALRALVALAEDPSVISSVRLQAARAILHRAWTHPSPTEPQDHPTAAELPIDPTPPCPAVLPLP